ncbi:MAG: 3-dehydroquinate synthase [Candidatus Omnitrophica bacterium]|nr:3-dehydroquinate synthase [Candidatus Omnitrophota bacterium]
MQRIKLDLGGRSYNIIVGFDILPALGKTLKKLNIGTDAYIITNALIRRKFGAKLEDSLKGAGFTVRFKVVADTEKSKSIETAAGVIRDLALYDNKRRIFVIAFGGGVIGDLSGFVASIYKRGIPYVQVPTTLLAQVDSAIGGKTAVDLSEGKNLVGAIYQPRLVFSDCKFLSSLNPRQLRSGLAEVIKYAIIKDKSLFNYLFTNIKDILFCKRSALERIVLSCSSIKAKVVKQDEREERGIRTILNFGHTAGHAIEAAAGFTKYTHGEAIALGMLVACEISKMLELIDEPLAVKVEALISKAGLPTKIRAVKLERIISAHYRDKKFIGPRNKFVLIGAIGKVKIVTNVPLEVITESLKKKF